MITYLNLGLFAGATISAICLSWMILIIGRRGQKEDLATFKQQHGLAERQMEYNQRAENRLDLYVVNTERIANTLDRIAAEKLKEE